MKRLISTLGLAAAALLPLAPANAAILYLVPAVQDAASGSSITFDVMLNRTGLVGQIASAYDIDVLFDSAALGGASSGTINTAILGASPLDYFAGFTMTAGDAAAQASSFLDDASVLALQPGDPLRLFSFSVTALMDGVTHLDFGPDADFQRNVVGLRGQTLSLTYQGACVAVGANFAGGCNTSSVTEPGTLGLLGLGLLGIAGLRRRMAA